MGTLCNPTAVARQAPLSMTLPRQEYWTGLPCPSPGGSSWSREWTQVSCIAGRFFIIWTSTKWKCLSTAKVLKENWDCEFLKRLRTTCTQAGTPLNFVQNSLGRATSFRDTPSSSGHTPGNARGLQVPKPANTCVRGAFFQAPPLPVVIGGPDRPISLPRLFQQQPITGPGSLQTTRLFTNRAELGNKGRGRPGNVGDGKALTARAQQRGWAEQKPASPIGSLVLLPRLPPAEQQQFEQWGGALRPASASAAQRGLALAAARAPRPIGDGD